MTRAKPNPAARPIEALEPRTLLAASVVDLAVFYTPAAVMALGLGASEAQLHQRIAADVADANLAFANSQIDIELRLVLAAPVNYVEGPTMAADLDRIRRTDDGILDEVHVARANAGADLVALYRTRGASLISGISYELTNPTAALPDPITGKAPAAAFAFSVVAADEPWVLAHEVGHSFGAGHDKTTDPDGGMTAYAAGYRHDHGEVRFRTIMAYGSEPLIPHFSNPAISYEGIPTGIDNDADNARAMNLVAPAVASYYAPPIVEEPPPPPPPPDTAAPRATLVAATLRRAVARPYRFSITFTDASPISGRSVRNAVLVVGPNRFRQIAQLFSLKSFAGGTRLVAVYQVTPPGKSWNPLHNGSYQVKIRARTVFDAAGNFMPVQRARTFKIAIRR